MTIRVGVIGLGVMGRRMIGRMLGHGGYACVVGWDPDPGALAAACTLVPGMRPASGPVDLVAESGLDLVYIASPPALHMAQVALALDAGRAVLCEKPLSVDLAPAMEMVARIAAGRYRAAVNFPLASLRAMALMQAQITAGSVGRIRTGHIEATFREWPRLWQQGGAAWLDDPRQGGLTREVVSHFLFVMRRLLGPLQVLDSRVEYPEPDRAERELSAKITAGGVLVTIRAQVGGAAAEDRNHTMIEGDIGALRLADWHLLERGTATGWVPVPDARDDQPDGHRHLDAVADWLAGRPHPLASFAEALDVQRAVEAMLAVP